MATAPARARLRPLTERILERLPGPHVLWIVVWALVPWVNAATNLLLDSGRTSAVWEQSRALVVLNYAALSHRQMLDVKASELATARQLYAEAYEPVRSAGTLEALERQHRLLDAADALESRARAIHEWPIDEGTVARVITITTSVIAITVGRLILDPFGLENMRYKWRKWLHFDCNWKVAMEAFNETYHVFTTHPEFNKFGEFKGWAKAQGKHSNIGYDAPKDMEATKSKIRLGTGDDPRVSTAEMQMYTWEQTNATTTETLVNAAKRLVDELPEGTPADKVLEHWLASARRDDEARGVIWPTIPADILGQLGHRAWWGVGHRDALGALHSFIGIRVQGRGKRLEPPPRVRRRRHECDGAYTRLARRPKVRTVAIEAIRHHIFEREQPLVHDRLAEDGRGGGAVTRDVRGLARHFAHHLRAHVRQGIFQVDFLGDSHAVLGDRG